MKKNYSLNIEILAKQFMNFCIHIFQRNGTESCIKCGSKKPLNFKE